MTLDNVKAIRLLDNQSEVGLFNKISIFNNRDIEAKPTDLALLSGGTVDSLGFIPYWTQTIGRDHVAVITSSEFTKDHHYSCDKNALQPAIRPLLEMNKVPAEDEVTGGEYPQFVEPDEDIAIDLETIAKHKKLTNITGKNYTIGNKVYIEYAYKGNKYILFESKTDGLPLSNGKLTRRGQVYPVKVSPVTWLVDHQKNFLLSKYGLLSGISYWGSKTEQDKYEKSNMYDFINEKMKGDITTISEIRKVNEFSAYLSTNPLNLYANDLTDNERIQKLIQSGVAPFLHGQTGVGKSARVKQEDDDVTIIYLCYQTIDSLNGKNVYVPPLTKRQEVKVQVEENGKLVEKTEWQDVVIEEGHMEDVPPAWLVKLQKKCAEKPDKLHIVFFDEITNALPAIQGFCFNIILNREVNGIWKLPDNARVVAAGNELDDSIAACELAEPLFGRFAHIYIDDNIKAWLNWAQKTKIHPAIITFMAATNGKNLRTKYNGKKPNADPRKWEMASKVLKATNNIQLLEGLIGADLTKSFEEFCKLDSITLEDVIAGRYSEYDLQMDSNRKYITALTMSRVEIDDFEKVYDFMMKVGPEPCAVFESLWVADDEEKAEKLLEVKYKYREEREEAMRRVTMNEAEIADQINKMAQQEANKGKRK